MFTFPPLGILFIIQIFLPDALVEMPLKCLETKKYVLAPFISARFTMHVQCCHVRIPSFLHPGLASLRGRRGETKARLSQVVVWPSSTLIQHFRPAKTDVFENAL